MEQIILVALRQDVLEGFTMLLILSCIGTTPKETALIDSSNAGHELNAPDDIDDCSVSSIPVQRIETMRTCEPPTITVQDTWNIKKSQHFTYNFSQCWIGAIADFNRDGILDIVCSVNMARVTLYIISGDGTGIIFESDLPMPHSPIAIADVDGDGWIELFALNRFGKPISFDHEGVINWRSIMEFLWTPDVSMPEPYCKTNLIISDPMSVGYPVVSTFNGGVDASTGRIFLNRRQSDSSLRSETRTRITAISDLNQDGISEIYDFKSQINWSGDILWDQSLPGEQFVYTWDIPIQADTDPEGELFVSTYPGMALYDTDGSLLAHTPISDMGDYYEPCSGDMDGDGVMEYIQPSRRGLIRLRQPDGSLILETDISSLTDIEPDDINFGNCSVFDFDMDGKMEAVVNYHGVLLVINGTGDILWHTPTNWSSTTPIVIDIDGDGSAEIINIDYGTNNHGGNVISYIDIYKNTLRNWPPGKRIWSGNAWTGVELFEDGSVPRHPAPSWTTTKLWRGEPAWSEEGADLAPEIVDSCETSQADGKVRLSVRLQNLGPQDAPAGTPLAVYRIDEQGNKTLDQILYLNTLLEAQMGSQSWELVFDKKDILGGVDLVAGDEGHGTRIGRDCDSRNNLMHYSSGQ